ncbi:phage tail protein [Aminipila sp.]|uniref:phage tail protein n=1 Tax=Aminipila sp. TaxID=2060095 RepID=UPI0028A144CA|nr:phage tail protein [Aminipila sp.]
MEDRNVQYPMRYRDKITGQIFDFEEMPGTVTNAGTPLNKANLLSDAVATKYSLNGLNATPNKALDKALVPAGCVLWFANSTPPANFLYCNGAAVSRSTYADLFTAIGTKYGSGNGTTTFNLPDLRGAFIRGIDDGKGIDTAITIVGQISTQTNKGGYVGYVTPTGPYNSLNLSQWDTNGGVRPYNIALLPCIKY